MVPSEKQTATQRWGGCSRLASAFLLHAQGCMRFTAECIAQQGQPGEVEGGQQMPETSLVTLAPAPLQALTFRVASAALHWGCDWFTPLYVDIMWLLARASGPVFCGTCRKALSSKPASIAKFREQVMTAASLLRLLSNNFVIRGD